jgi:hypothetical protein
MRAENTGLKLFSISECSPEPSGSISPVCAPIDICRCEAYITKDEPTGNMKLGGAKTVDEYRSRALVEKKTVLNLLLAYA